MRYLLLVALCAACGGGKAPETMANPARGLRNLGPDSAAVSDMAVEAARSLPPQRSTQPLFGGVYVNDRLSRTATDAVKRATGFTVTSTTRQPEVRCRVQTSGGASRDIPCPPQAAAAVPPSVSFVSVRATGDSAYVGLLEVDGTAERSSCITLVRRTGGWSYLSNSIIASAKNCGK